MANINTEGIVLHKRLLNHWLYKELRIHSKYEAWIWILLNAAHRSTSVESHGHKYNLKRGQFTTNLSELAKEFQWSRGKVKRFLDKLMNESMLKYNIPTYKRTLNGHKTDTKTLIVTISKYESYNIYKKTSEHKTDTKRTNMYNRSIKIYSTFYVKHIKEPYMWNIGLDDNCIKKLIDSIEKSIINHYSKSGQEDFQVPDDMLLQKFESFLENMPEFYITNSLSLQTLSKGYNTIVQQISKKVKTDKNNGKQQRKLQGNIFGNK